MMRGYILSFIYGAFFVALVISTFFMPHVESAHADDKPPKYPSMVSYCSMARADHLLIGEAMPERLFEMCE